MNIWYFPEDLGGEQNGLNDAGIEFFKSAGSLARETVQNSGDAHNGTEKPVRVRFHLRKVASSEFPGREHLATVMKQAQEFLMSVCTTPEQRAANGEEFFSRAVALLNNGEIPVLQIADYNTTGLEGTEAEQMKGWYRLVRKQGTTSMHGAGGGTFGIGQRAPFAYSGLRTVFYGTRTQDGVSKFIGKSILCSFRDEEQRIRRAVGFWGTKKEQQNYGVNPLADLSELSPTFRREAAGTDLFITGFAHGTDWMDDVLHSVIRNFFAAVLHGKLVVEFEDDFTLKKLTLDASHLQERIAELLERVENSDRSAAEKREVKEELRATQYYLSALSNPHEGKPITAELPNLGTVSLFLALNDEAPSKLAYMRRPRILVFDRTQRAGLRGYAGVFICENQKGNKLLAELEDPAHTKWERGRAKNGAKILQELNAFVREALNAVAGSQDNEAQDIPELGKYLPADPNDAAEMALGGTQVTKKASADETGQVTPRAVSATSVTRMKRAAAPTKKPETGPSNGEDDGASGGQEHGEGEGGGGGGGDAAGDGAGNMGGAEAGPIALRDTDIDYRSFVESSGAVRLIVWAKKAGTADLVVKGAGISGKVSLPIKAAEDEQGNALASSEGVIRGLLFQKGTPRRLLISLGNPGRVAISVGVLNHG